MDELNESTDRDDPDDPGEGTGPGQRIDLD
jgi:hypothetical protein